MTGETNDPPLSRIEEIVSQCGGYPEAVAKVMDFGRALWELAFLEELGDSAQLSRKYQYQIINVQRLKYARFQTDKNLLNVFLDHLREKGLCRASKDLRYAGLDTTVFDPAALVRHFLGGLKEETELRYFVRREIRRKYRREQSSPMAHFFHLLADAMNKALEAGALFTSMYDKKESSFHCNYIRDFLPYMSEVLRNDRQWQSQKEGADQEEFKEPDILKMFVECCRYVGYLSAHHRKRGHIRVRTQIVDSEYLLSHLFGMPTSISGFDDLFGGGGLILAEDLEEDKENGKKAERLNGRTILIKGRFGTGKSLLSMQLAVEVARKGGLAWIMPLEQTAEECLYTLESMAVLPRDESVFVAKTRRDALKALYQSDAGEETGDAQRKDADRGALIILNVITKSSYNEFLPAFAGNAKRMRRYPLRMISVDPINSISRRDPQRADLRAFVFEKLEEIRELGTNVLLVAEEATKRGELQFEQNIADTVIHLSINKQRHNNYAQRYFEITKSRFQREQRGEHAFSIVPGKGFRIFPSTAAVRARIYARGASLWGARIEIEPLSEKVLVPGSVLAGDVIVFQGPSGTFKTPLGVPFLLGSDAPRREGEEREAEAPPDDGGAPLVRNPNVKRPKKSLFIATRDNKPTVQRMFMEFKRTYLKGRQNDRGSEKTLDDDVIIAPLRHGYVQPGYILQSIEDEFHKAQVEGYSIDRVMVDNISHWEMSCPFIRDDEAFGNTLLDFLRRRGVTSLVICGEPSRDERSVLQQSISDNADCVFRFSRPEQAGQQRIFMKVIKTHNIEAHEDYFELIRTGNEITFQPPSRKEDEGGLNPPPPAASPDET